MAKLFWVATLAVVATLAMAGCGSSRHAAFGRWSRVGGLSVPTPLGFHEFRWARGVGITDLPTVYLRQLFDPGSGIVNPPTYPDGVVLTVQEGVSHGPAPPPLRLPLSLNELRRGSGGYVRYWGGAFWSDACTGTCFVDVWLGPKAPAADRAAVLRALGSVKRLRAST